MATPDDNDRLRDGSLGSPLDGTVPVRVGPSGPPIVTVKAFWFIREPSGYYQIDKSNAAVEMARLHGDLKLGYEDKEGKWIPYGARQLYEQHGRRADTVTYELGGTSRYLPRGDAEGGELVLGCCRMPEIEPEYDERIDEWLALMGGDRLYDWLALCHRLQEPIAALYLRGDPGSGKGMLADGIAAQWGSARTSYEDVVLGSYTGALIRCPVIHLDERAPEDRTGRASGAFRSITANSTHPLTEKYAPSATIKGCPRLVITANDDDALRLSADEARRADEAIGVRILHLVCSSDAVALLRELGGRRATHDWVVEPDGSPGRIPRFIAWLRLNWRVTKPGNRLLVEGDPAVWTRGVAARRGLPQRILVATVRILLGHAYVPHEAGHDDPVWVHDGHVAVSVAELRRVWREAAGEDQRPGDQQLGAALNRIGRRARIQRGGARPWVYLLDLETLVQAVEETGCADAEDVRAALRRRDEPGR